MAVKTDRLETRLSPHERARIERAASTSGVSMSAFMVGAAVDRADEIIAGDIDGRAGELLRRLPEDAPPRLARGAPGEIPAILLAWLALDSSLQGQGLGSELLVHALETIVAAGRRAGGRVVLVDAIDNQAKEFYEHHDFEPLPGHARRLVKKLSTAAKALDMSWP